MTKLRLGLVTYVVEKRIACGILVTECKDKDCCRDQDIDGRKI
jgi:hypothetical protein